MRTILQKAVSLILAAGIAGPGFAIADYVMRVPAQVTGPAPLLRAYDTTGAPITAPVDYGSVTVGTAAGSTWAGTLRNTGNAVAGLAAARLDGDAAFSLSTGPSACAEATSLAPGQSCNVYVTFSPVTTASVDAVYLQGPAGGQPVSLSLTGTGIAPVEGQRAFTSPGSYSWVVPDGVYSVSMVAVGAGGGGGGGAAATAYNYGGGGSGGGGGLSYVNNVAVTPGEALTIVVGAPGSGGSQGGERYKGLTGGTGGASQILRGATVLGQAFGGTGGSGGGLAQYGGGVGGSGGAGGPAAGAPGGGRGGNGSAGSGNGQGAGGGGAGGYAGSGGLGGRPADKVPGSPGAGGAGGGGGPTTNNLYRTGGDGGGVGILGQGANGTGGAVLSADGGAGVAGSGGSATSFGGGGAGASQRTGGRLGGPGAVRLIWPGDSRQYPSLNTADR